MKKTSFDGMWDRLRLLHGIGLRAIAALPENALDQHPIAKMRTPKELVVHTYATSVRALAEGCAAGEIVEPDEKMLCARIRSRDELLSFCRESWTAADRAARTMTDEKLAAPVKDPWNPRPSAAARYLNAVVEEYLHHRGQLYAYLRALGVEPPDVFDFTGNAPEFQPAKTTPA